MRDLDAHSWVEAWFPGYGWVTFDPTPAAAPPRSQSSDRGTAAHRRRAATWAAARSTRAPAVAAEEGTDWRPIAGLRRRSPLLVLGGGCRSPSPAPRPPPAAPLLELERALRARAARPAPGATLHGARGVASPARPTPRATCARCATSATRPPAGAPTPRPAARPAQRARARRRAAADGSAHGGRCRRARRLELDGRWTDVYDLFQRGTQLLEAGDYHAATVPLARARDLEPDKTSIREALGRAFFRSRQFEAAGRSSRPSSSARRPTTTRSSASAARCTSSGRHAGRAPAARAGRGPASRPPRLPHLPRPRAGCRVGPPVLYVRATAFRFAPPGRGAESGR